MGWNALVTYNMTPRNYKKEQYHNWSGIRVTNRYEWCIWCSRTVNQTGVAGRGVAVVPVVTVPAKDLNDKERRVTERLIRGEPEKRAREGGIREVSIFSTS
jgi:hypothetical protein